MPESKPGRPVARRPFRPNRLELSRSTQEARLGTQFKHLSKALATDGDGLSLREDPSSIAPERALVLEVAESITNFQDLANKTNGLEYLADEDFDFEPEEGFSYVDTRQGRNGEPRLDKPISGKVYIAMPNVQALNELLRLWRIWQQEQPFPHGLTNWRHLFESLRNIRPWGVVDRIGDDAIAFWSDDISSTQSKPRRIEVELWYFKSPLKRKKLFQEFEQALQDVGGSLIQRSVIDEIRYDGVLVDVPSTELESLIQRKGTRLATCDSIMHITPQSVIDLGDTSEEPVQVTSVRDLLKPGGPPVAALFDGVPIQRHDLLVDRIDFDDPEDLEAMSVSGKRDHGTEMASLVIHGDRNVKQDPISRTLYVRPVMYSPADQSDDTAHKERLFVDTIYNAVVRMKEGVEDTPPSAPNVFVVNFSIGITTRPFGGHVSPLARLLDYLSERYNILFLVSAGNILEPLELKTDLNWTQFEDADPDERQRIVLHSLNESKAYRTLLSPAEALNVITVGSWSEDQTDRVPDTLRVNPYTDRGFPNISSALGLGYKRAVKPDLHLPGGRESVRLKSTSPLQVLPLSGACGLLCATSDPNALGLLDQTNLVSGTSAATALATHAAHQLFETITDEDNGLVYSSIDPEFYAVVIKALLVHRSRWGNHVADVEDLFGPSGRGKYVQQRDNLARLMGYGLAHVEEAESCDPHRATLVGCGVISAGCVDIHRIPLPICLSNTTKFRALTITVSWMSPVNFGHQSYRRARLEVAPVGQFDDTVGVTRAKIQPSDKSVPRGTVFHCRYEGNESVSFASDSNVELRVTCRPQAGGIDEAIRYGIAVSLESVEGVPVYQQVRSQLGVAVASG